MAQMIELRDGEIKIPEWTQGKTYRDGTVVSYNGTLCVTHDGLPQPELSVSPVREVRISDRNTGNFTTGSAVIDLDGTITLSINLHPLIEQYVAQEVNQYVSEEVNRRIGAEKAIYHSTLERSMNARFEKFKQDVLNVINEHTNINITEEEFMKLVQ